MLNGSLLQVIYLSINPLILNYGPPNQNRVPPQKFSHAGLKGFLILQKRVSAKLNRLETHNLYSLDSCFHHTTFARPRRLER